MLDKIKFNLHSVFETAWQHYAIYVLALCGLALAVGIFTSLTGDIGSTVGILAAILIINLFAIFRETQAQKRRLQGLDEQTTMIKARIDDLSSEMKGIKAKLRDMGEGSQSFQTFSRFLPTAAIGTFIQKWSTLLGLDLKPTSLAYQADRVRMIEKNSTGRLATSIENAVLRCLVARSVKSKELEILEIGSLFGIGLTVVYDSTRAYFEKVRISALDPLTGYYGAGNLDRLLSIPVHPDIFWHNVRVADIDLDDVRLIQRLSSETEAIREAGERQYDVLIIDGDHSYEGVKFDYDNYLKFVRIGGYIIIDDYGAVPWPEIKRYVDETVVHDPRVELVGAEWTTAVFKRIQ